MLMCCGSSVATAGVAAAGGGAAGAGVAGAVNVGGTAEGVAGAGATFGSGVAGTGETPTAVGAASGADCVGALLSAGCFDDGLVVLIFDVLHTLNRILLRAGKQGRRFAKLRSGLQPAPREGCQK